MCIKRQRSRLLVLMFMPRWCQVRTLLTQVPAQEKNASSVGAGLAWANRERGSSWEVCKTRRLRCTYPTTLRAPSDNKDGRLGTRQQSARASARIRMLLAVFPMNVCQFVVSKNQARFTKTKTKFVALGNAQTISLFTFGIKTKHRVMVVQNTTKTDSTT